MTNDYGNLELHKVLLSAMKDIDKICRENGLKYYLHAGTLLGAFNHQGFIPWDDDVDISIFYEDYKILKEILQKDYSDIYFFQTYETDPEHRHNRACLKILGTRLIHNGGEKFHSEIGIDIVPLYGVPDSKFFQKIQKYQIMFWDIVIQIKFQDIIPQKPWTKFLQLFAKLNREWIGKKVDRIMIRGSKNNSKKVGVLCYNSVSPFNRINGYDDNNTLREYYENPIYVKFEDTQFMTMSDPEIELDRRYPHWREPYPEEKRITKHDVKSYEISPEVRARIGL